MAHPSSLPPLITVFGGSGFVGRHVVRALAKKGYRIRVACRRPDLAGHLQPLGNVGQIQVVQANIRHRWSVDRAVIGADHVINLVGILHESGKQKFNAVQDFGARAIAEATRGVGAKLTHVSAIGANCDSQSDYAKTKGDAEKAVAEISPQAVIMRPSVVFGPEDEFFNRFAQMTKLTAAMPLFGGGNTQFQPVFVGDVAKAIVASVEGRAQEGAIYELGGPQVLSFKQCIEYILKTVGRKRLMINVPWWAAKLMGTVLGIMPSPMLTKDQVTLLQSDNVVSADALANGHTFEGLGIEPRLVSSIVPSYLWRYRPAGQFTQIDHKA